jgi:hypothetical protein
MPPGLLLRRGWDRHFVVVVVVVIEMRQHPRMQVLADVLWTTAAHRLESAIAITVRMVMAIQARHVEILRVVHAFFGEEE